MSAPCAVEIRRHLAAYLAGRCSLEAFEEWFVPHALSIAEESVDAEVQEMTYEIELRLAEFSNGDWAEDELRGMLRPLVEPYPVA